MPDVLPDGSTTNNPDTYVAAWREFAAPLAKTLGAHASAYDPGVTYTFDSGASIGVDAPVVRAFNELYEEWYLLSEAPAKVLELQARVDDLEHRLQEPTRLESMAKIASEAMARMSRMATAGPEGPREEDMEFVQRHGPWVREVKEETWLARTKGRPEGQQQLLAAYILKHLNHEIGPEGGAADVAIKLLEAYYPPKEYDVSRTETRVHRCARRLLDALAKERHGTTTPIVENWPPETVTGSAEPAAGE